MLKDPAFLKGSLFISGVSEKNLKPGNIQYADQILRSLVTSIMSYIRDTMDWLKDNIIF